MARVKQVVGTGHSERVQAQVAGAAGRLAPMHLFLYAGITW